MHTYQVIEKGAPLTSAERALLLIHGRGASARDILSLADEFVDSTCYIAAPQATNQTWYPYGFMTPETDNQPWLQSAVDTVRQLIGATVQHIPFGQIYLMGFSQGACLTLEVAARDAHPYAGVVAFTGGLIGAQVDRGKYHGDFAGAKIFIGNSDRDPHVPEERSAASAQVLGELGGNVRYQVYPGMPHTITRAEVDAVRNWMF